MVGRARPLGLLWLAAAVALSLSQLGGGCAGIDPTDPSNYIDVVAVNDTGSEVNLIQCDTSCDTLHQERLLAPGESTELRVSNNGGEIGYAVESPQGRRLGCLYLSYDHVDRAPPVSISSLAPCH